MTVYRPLEVAAPKQKSAEARAFREAINTEEVRNVSKPRISQAV